MPAAQVNGTNQHSAVAQRALRDELDRRVAVAAHADEMQRIEVTTEDRGEVAFTGREIAADYDRGDVAYLTRKGAVAIHDGKSSRLYVYDSFADLAEEVARSVGEPSPMIADIAASLGEKYVQELDI